MHRTSILSCARFRLFELEYSFQFLELAYLHSFTSSKTIQHMNPLFMLTIYAKELLNSLFFYPDAVAIAIAAASSVAGGSLGCASFLIVLIRVRTAHMIVQLIVRINFWFDLIWFWFKTTCLYLRAFSSYFGIFFYLKFIFKKQIDSFNRNLSRP